MKKCKKCDKPSIRGLSHHVGLCQFHYNELQWGTAWAERCRDENDREAQHTDPGAPAPR